MRKLFVALLILSVMGGAFAQVSVGGGAEASVVLAGGGDDIKGSGSIDLARIALSGENDAGTFGGYVRADFSGAIGGIGVDIDNDGTDDFTMPEGLTTKAHAWWKPIDQLKIIIGQPGDGVWGKDGVTGWGFTGPAKQVAIEGYGYNAFFGGTGGGTNQLHFEIKPIDLLGINIALPYFAGGKVEDIFKGITAQVDVNLDFGNIALSYQGNSGNATNGDLYLFVGLNVISNVDLHFSGHFVLPGDVKDQQIGAGLGAEITISDAFGLKARLNAEFGGKPEGKLGLLFDILPYFTVSDSLKVFANLGISVNQADKNADAVIGYIVNPYIQIDGGGPAFWAGFQLSGTTASGSKAKWAIPIGITFGF